MIQLQCRHFAARFASLSLALTCLLLCCDHVRASVVSLNNGMQIEGKLGKIAAMGKAPLAPGGEDTGDGIKQIILVDDDLRRVFVSFLQVANVAESPAVPEEKIKVAQRIASGGRRIAAVGPIIRETPFDEWGRRIFSMNTAAGRVDVIQGITEITPRYTKVEGLTSRFSYEWDMRIATSSLPRTTLNRVLHRQIDSSNPDQRLQIVRLFIQAERYKDARLELEGVLADFPELEELKKQVAALHQLGAKRIIREIELRRDAGQHELAWNMCKGFPVDGVAGETLLQVREILADYEKLAGQGNQVIQLLDKHLAEIKEDQTREKIQAVREEMAEELNFNTLDRMADYLRLSEDETLAADQKLALAISGWLLGSGEGTENLAVALSLYEVRNLVREYLSGIRRHERDAIIEKLKTMEGGTPEYVAQLVLKMKPALKTDFPAPPEEAEPENDLGIPLAEAEANEEEATETESPFIPGFLTLSVPGLVGKGDFQYHVQLPPEYDPYRRYPCIVTLNGAGTTAQQQIDWWAGAFDPRSNSRLGQASRQGYVVIAPVWTKPHQSSYEYSAEEHAAVLYSLRDACRRFSINTDKVFLSGHSMGGDAAWDIALAHPDLWAGAMPIVPAADKYITRYWQNAKYVPLYFVAGEMDGDKLGRNGPVLDRYLNRSGYDVMYVEYRGRGHEHFHDEIQQLFEWMKLHQRDFYPREFETVSMRPWDNFFWWVELEAMPANSMVTPARWPPDAGVRPITSSGRILDSNGLYLKSGAGSTVVWLSPDMVDFTAPIFINGRKADVEPSAGVLLEDVRIRGDRQHPFWAKTEPKR